MATEFYKNACDSLKEEAFFVGQQVTTMNEKLQIYSSKLKRLQELVTTFKRLSQGFSFEKKDQSLWACDKEGIICEIFFANSEESSEDMKKLGYKKLPITYDGEAIYIECIY